MAFSGARGFGLSWVRGAFGGLVLAVGLFGLWAVAFVGTANASSACGTHGVLSMSGSTRTCTYSSTGTDTFTVPSGQTSIAAIVVGGGGGGGSAGFTDVNGNITAIAGGGGGGAGGTVSATISVTTGQQCTVTVGGGGGSPGYNNQDGSGNSGGSGGESSISCPLASASAGGGGGGGGGNGSQGGSAGSDGTPGSVQSSATGASGTTTLCNSFAGGSTGGVATSTSLSPAGNGGGGGYLIFDSSCNFNVFNNGAGVGGNAGAVSVTYTETSSDLAQQLVTDSTGVGPGKALFEKATAIQTAVNASPPQTATACAGITDYLGLVKAQANKKLSSTQATTLTTDVNNLSAALGCT